MKVLHFFLFAYIKKRTHIIKKLRSFLPSTPFNLIYNIYKHKHKIHIIIYKLHQKLYREK